MARGGWYCAFIGWKRETENFVGYGPPVLTTGHGSKNPGLPLALVCPTDFSTLEEPPGALDGPEGSRKNGCPECSRRTPPNCNPPFKKISLPPFFNNNFGFSNDNKNRRQSNVTVNCMPAVTVAFFTSKLLTLFFTSPKRNFFFSIVSRAYNKFLS